MEIRKWCYFRTSVGVLFVYCYHDAEAYHIIGMGAFP